MRLVKRSRTKSQSLNSNCCEYQMCLIYADFKHFLAIRRKIVRAAFNDSSIIRANASSIMRIEA